MIRYFIPQLANAERCFPKVDLPRIRPDRFYKPVRSGLPAQIPL